MPAEKKFTMRQHNGTDYDILYPKTVATQVIEDATHKFITDAERTTWNAKQNALGFTPENAAKKGVANGYASLDAAGKIPSAQMPTISHPVVSVNGQTGAVSLNHTHVGAIAAAEKGKANGVASLDANGKLLESQLPALAITDTFTVADEAEMLKLVAQPGDIAIRTDISRTFILATAPASAKANWIEFRIPGDAVVSVNGQTGAVSLNASHVGALALTEVVTAATANKVLKLDATGKLPASITGNAATATKLATARTIAVSGAATGSASFDGSANATIALTLKDSGVTAGTFSKLTVDAKGIVTKGANLTRSELGANQVKASATAPTGQGTGDVWFEVDTTY